MLSLHITTHHLVVAHHNFSPFCPELDKGTSGNLVALRPTRKGVLVIPAVASGFGPGKEQGAGHQKATPSKSKERSELFSKRTKYFHISP